MKKITKLSIIILISLSAPLYGCKDRVESHKIDFQEKLTREILEKSLEVGTDFLVNNQKEEGNFNYEYNFITKKFTNGDNQVRQAGALWGIALTHQAKPSEKTEKAMLKGMEFFNKHSKVTDDGRKYIAYPGFKSGSTGTVALVLLSFVDYIRSNNDPEIQEKYKEDVNSYVKFLLSLRLKNGQFYGSYSLADGKGFGKPSPYFDGESLLALIKTAKYAGHGELKETILESAEAMYKINIKNALKTNPDSDTTKGFYQWSSMAYYEIYTTGWEGSKKYAKRVIDLAYWMIDVHETLRRTRNTAYAYEGLISAWKLAQLTNNTEAVNKIGRVIDRGLYKLTSWQVGGPIENRFLRRHPTTDPKAVGGIMNKNDEPTLRIDVTQHQMHAVILALKLYFGEQKKIVFVGDTSFGENYPDSSKILAKNGYDYPFEKLAPLLEDSDFVVANLETPITDLKKSPYERKKPYIHWTDVEKTPASLKKYGVDAVSLANNHVLDFGIAGLAQTLKILKENSISSFGAGMNEAEACLPLTQTFDIGKKQFRIAVIAPFELREEYEKEFSFYADKNSVGVCKLSKDSIGEQIKKIKKETPSTFVVVYPHWGKNYSWKNSEQTKEAHHFINSGADLVIGHGAHVMQEIEKYKEGWIIYSLGNFVFLSPGRYEKMKTAPFSIASQLIIGEKNKQIQLYPIHTNNIENNYQSRPLSEDEFENFTNLLLSKSSLSKEERKKIAGKKDKIGYFLQLKID